MPWQREVAEDPARFRAVRTPRQVGKSWLSLSLALEDCLRHDNRRWVIIGLTKPSVRSIYWGVMKKLNKDMELGGRPHGTNLEVTFPNGSVLMFTGAQDRAEIEKLRGSQFDGVIVDECKSYNPEMFKEMIFGVLLHTLSVRQGLMILIGTPGEILKGPFFEATCQPSIAFKAADGSPRWSNRRWGTPDDGIPSVWSLHTATQADNIACPQVWQDSLGILAKNGWGQDHPWFQREALGNWVASDDYLVYRYHPHEHDYDGELPEGHTWIPVMGFDIGFKDADAIVVWMYARTHTHLYEVYSEKRKKQGLGPMVRWIKEIQEQFKPECIVADFGGLATKVWESLAEEDGLVVEMAEKREKLDFIELFNRDFDAKRIHIVTDSALATELGQNRWLEKTIGTERRKEDPRTENDLCDAALYAFRYCDHRRSQPPERQSARFSPEWWDQYRREEMARAVEENKRRHGFLDDSRMDADWWSN